MKQKLEELEKMVDETKRNKTTNERKVEISCFARAIGDLQEQNNHDSGRTSKGFRKHVHLMLKN